MIPVNKINNGMVLPNAAIMTSANMIDGIESRASLTRLNDISRTLPPTAEAIPSVTPIIYARKVAIKLLEEDENLEKEENKNILKTYLPYAKQRNNWSRIS